MLSRNTRRLRGAIGNALLWGAAWSVAGFAAVAALTGSVLNGLVFAPRFAFIGIVAGAAFSCAIPLMYRGRRLSDISLTQFGIAGGILSGLLVPAFLQTMNVLTGDGPIAWGLLMDDAPLAAVLGGLPASGSLALARRARTLAAGSRPDLLGLGESVDPFSSPVRERAAR